MKKQSNGSTKSSKPATPHPDFPRFPHATRRWAKKVRGEFHFFGPWRDPEGALEEWLRVKDDLLAGRKPRDKNDPGGQEGGLRLGLNRNCPGDKPDPFVSAFQGESMPDDTNDLLRQLLDTQRQMLTAYQKEMERTSDFRIAATEMQRAAQRKAAIVAVIVAVGFGMLILGVLAAKN